MAIDFKEEKPGTGINFTPDPEEPPNQARERLTISGEFLGGLDQMASAFTDPSLGNTVRGIVGLVRSATSPMAPLTNLATTAGEAVSRGTQDIPGLNLRIPGTGGITGSDVLAGTTTAALETLSPALLVKGAGAGSKAIQRGAAKTFGTREAVAEAGSAIARKKLLPASSEKLYEIVGQKAATGSPVVPKNFQQSVSDILVEEAQNLPTSVRDAIIDKVGRFKMLLGNRQVAPRTLNTAAQDLRVDATKAFKEGNSRLGNALNNVRNSIFDDLADAGIEEARIASKAYRKEKAIDKLGELIRKSEPFSKFQDVMGKDKLFAGAFGPDEIQEIEGLLRKMRGVTPSGSAGVMGKAITTGIGAATGGAGGAIAGMTIPAAVRKALTTRAGRAYLEKLIEGGPMTLPKLSLLGSFVRGMEADQEPTPEEAQP